MKQDFPQVNVGKLCALFGVTRQAFYENSWQDDIDFKEGQLILEMVRCYRDEMRRIGGIKLYVLIKPQLQEMEIKVGRDRFLQILRENGLIIRRKKKRVFTTMSNHRFKKYPNIIKEISPVRADHIWVSDITYISLKERYCFLALITDVYSHRIVGFNLSIRLDTNNCLTALRMAIGSRLNESNDLIHHSDRGIQYCSNEYVELLTGNNIKISMTENGDPYENAIAERVNGILKEEFFLGEVFNSFEEAFYHTMQSISIYNSKRPHMSIDYRTPDQVYKQEGFIAKRWKNSRSKNYATSNN